MVSFKNLMSGGLLALSCVCAVAFSVQSAHAASAEQVPYDRALMAKLPSTNTDIGIAFLKMSGNFPDFAQVARDSDAYKSLNAYAQQEYEDQFSKKMQSDYMAFSPKKTDIIIRMKANVGFFKPESGEGTLTLKTFSADPVYLPFYFAKYPIAMIIKDMENFREIHLTKEETDIVYSRLPLSGDVTLLLQLYGVAANDKQPIMLDNIPQYPFLTEIGYIGFLNNQAEQIWAWRNSKLTGKPMVGGSVKDLRDLIPGEKASTNTPQTNGQ